MRKQVFIAQGILQLVDFSANIFVRGTFIFLLEADVTFTVINKFAFIFLLYCFA